MLTAENISFERKKKIFLNNISLSFEPGKLHGILGPNGAGKSTFLKTLAGIWKPTSGKVLWKKENLLDKPRSLISQIVSLVPQNPQSAFSFTVEEMVAMGRYSLKHNLKVIQNSLEAVNAWQFRHVPITELSQGEKQRVYIARALATEAPILLLDEPTTSLDICHQITVWQLLQQIAANGKVVIATMHDLQAAKLYCDKVTIIHRGEFVASGKFADILTPSVMQQVFNLNLELGHSFCRL